MRDEERSSLIHPSSLIPHPFVAAILLAAGRSSRMGAFKPLLPFGETTVIEACVDYLGEGGAGEIVVVLGHRAEEVRARLEGLPLRFALNPDPSSEMGASIARGVEQVSQTARAVLIALVDHPAVPPEVVRLLISEHERTRSPLVLPTYEGRGGHPVLVDLAFREELSALDPQSGLRALFDAHRAEVLRLPVRTPYVARDMDRWDDYLALHREVFGKEPVVSSQ